jgi:hypothetical protein
MLINIILLLLGFIGAIVAIGGDTWHKGEKQLIRRITKRGWIAILVLALILALGIVKEFSAQIEGERLAISRAELKDKLLVANNNLEVSNNKLDAAHLERVKIKSELKAYKEIMSQIAAESERQIQWVLADLVNIRQSGVKTMRTRIYPGSIVKFMGFECDYLLLEYNNTRTRIPPSVTTPYEIAIEGPSGRALEWRLHNDSPVVFAANCSGKVYVLSTPRVRSTQSSGEEEVR